jgi:hypothetical protein
MSASQKLSAPVDPQVRIGHIHLKVADLCDLQPRVAAEAFTSVVDWSGDRSF